MSASLSRESALQPGALIGDRFKVVERLGGGGHGNVYRCRDTRMGRHLAVKVLSLNETARNRDVMQERRRRFFQEATAAGQIHHQSIIDVFDVDAVRMADGREHLLIAMQLLEGTDLETFLDDEGAMEPQRLLPLFIEMCRGIGEGHARGIVHKDLKPANMILHAQKNDRERLVVVDFGIASMMHHDRLTQLGNLIGTPNYLAPEYIEHQQVTPRFDVYQLGLILVELLTGVKVVPETASFIDACSVHVAGTLNLPQDIMLGPLGPIIRTACARCAEDRYGDATEFAEALETVDPASIEVLLDRSLLPTIPHLPAQPLLNNVDRRPANAAANDDTPAPTAQTTVFLAPGIAEALEDAHQRQRVETAELKIVPGVVPQPFVPGETVEVVKVRRPRDFPYVTLITAFAVILTGLIAFALLT